MSDDLVWFVAYGPNILYEQFKVSINGGRFRDTKKHYPGCAKKTLPQKDMPFILPYERYFGGTSFHWDDKGMAFLDPDKEGETCGRAYLITAAQFEEIKKAEGGWYSREIELDRGEDGIPCRTFTSKESRPHNLPGRKYRGVMEEGLRELARCLANQPNQERFLSLIEQELQELGRIAEMSGTTIREKGHR